LWKNAKALRKISQGPKLLAAYPGAVGEAVWRVNYYDFTFFYAVKHLGVGTGLVTSTSPSR
jgi:hypothetical protein